jgi:hypothetical protein
MIWNPLSPTDVICLHFVPHCRDPANSCHPHTTSIVPATGLVTTMHAYGNKNKHEFPEENSPFWIDGSNFLAESAFFSYRIGHHFVLF